MRTRLNNKDFNPSLAHPYYIIRSNLLKGILRNAQQLEGKMMDFGCGTKPYKPLFTKVSEYIGVDFNGEGHSHLNEQIDIFYDGKKIPFPDNTFDSILSTEVFEHIFNLEDILKELYRVLKPGGKILVTIPFMWPEHEMPNDFGRYTSLGFRALLERNNFKVLSMDKSASLVESLTQLWVAYWYLHIVPNLSIVGKLAPIFYFLSNAIGLVASRILPKRNDLFLNLIVVATK